MTKNIKRSNSEDVDNNKKVKIDDRQDEVISKHEEEKIANNECSQEDNNNKETDLKGDIDNKAHADIKDNIIQDNEGNTSSEVNDVRVDFEDEENSEVEDNYIDSDISTSYSSTEDHAFECLACKKFTLRDISFIVEKSKIFNDVFNLEEHVLDKICVMSNDIILYFMVLLDYNKMLSEVDKKIKKHVNNLLSEAKVDKESIGLLYVDKLCNIELLDVLKAIESIEYSKENYIYLCKLDPYCTEEEKQAFFEMFDDMKDEELPHLPSRIEEIFLFKLSKHKKNLMINNVPYKMFLLTKSEILEYVDILRNESKAVE